MREQRAMELIRETIGGLAESGMIGPVEVTPGTVLLGAGSPLDSLAFVTLIAELESRLQRETGKDVSLVLTELHDFTAGTPYLDAGTMARFTARLAGGE